MGSYSTISPLPVHLSFLKAVGGVLSVALSVVGPAGAGDAQLLSGSVPKESGLSSNGNETLPLATTRLATYFKHNDRAAPKRAPCRPHLTLR